MRTMNVDTPPTPDQSPTAVVAKARSSRVRRVVRRSIIALATIFLSIMLLGWIATRSWFIVWRLEPLLERKLGGDVMIGQASYRGGGRLAIEDFTLKARDLRGPAADIAVIDQLDVTLDLSSLFSGKVRLKDAIVSGMKVRISEDLTRPGSMNLMSLDPERGGGGGSVPPQRVRIRDLTLEVGVHAADTFVLNGRRRLAGEMLPIPGEEHWFAYELAEVDDRGTALGEAGFFVKGKWNYRTTQTQARIEAIKLNDRLQAMLPQQARWWWNRMDLAGRVDGVMIDWDPDAPLAVNFTVQDIAMTLPVELGEVWSVYRNGAVEPTTSRPRMNVHGGTIRVSTDSLHLESLRGELVSVPSTDAMSDDLSGEPMTMVGVPYEISLRVPSIPPIDWKDPENWMERALKTSAFELTARLDNFSLSEAGGGETQAVGLPSIVARTLAKFQATGWKLSTEVRVSRAQPARDDGGVVHSAPLRVTGQAYINDATGSYHKFPYRMEDVDAYLQFTDERVRVEYLQARGSGDSTFRMTGFIEPPDKDSLFHLEVTGTNVPLDDRFRAALKGKQLEAVESLFSLKSAERMARGGVLPDADRLAEQARTREELAAELTQARRSDQPDASKQAELEARIAALDRSIAAGAFETGGLVDVNLTLDRPLGPAQQTQIRGTVDVKSAGLIFDRFPYPLRGSGRLLWDTDRVSIDTGAEDNGGIRFVTPSGGMGLVSGSVSFPRNEEGGRKFLPDLNFMIADDRPNDALYAAIPFGRSEGESNAELQQHWPGALFSRSGAMVKGIGLNGAFDYVGHIGTRDDGKMNWDFRVRLDGGTAQPNVWLAEAIKARDVAWPRDMIINDLAGEVRIERSGVRWSEIRGVSDQTTISTSGTIDFRDRKQGGESDYASVRMINAPIHRNALNMIPAEHAARAEELWTRFAPQGWIDGEILWRSDAPPGEGGVVTLYPRDVSVMLGATRTTLQQRIAGEDQTLGHIRISGRDVRFDQLAFQLSCDHVPEGGVLSIDGQWTFAADAAGFGIAGAWRGGRLESPVIPEALRVFNQGAQATRYEGFQPAGMVDLAFDLRRSGTDQPLQYRFNFHPREVAFTLRETRVAMNIEEGSVSISPGAMVLEHLTGTAASGTFRLDGRIGTIEPTEIALDIGFTGRLRSAEVEAFLPQAVTDSLAALEFQDGAIDASPAAATVLSNGSLRMRQLGNTEGHAGWHSKFDGQIRTQNASFVAGVAFSEVDGLLELAVEHMPGQPLRLEAVGRATHAFVLGQDIYDVEAPMSINLAGDALEIPAVRARSGDGAVSASAVSGIGARRDYEVRVDMVGTPLNNVLRSPRTPAAAEPASEPVDPDENRAAIIGGEQTMLTHETAGTAAPSGEVFASLVIAGERGVPASKRGRGVFRVINGRLSAIPLALQAMNMMQFTLPLSGSLDYADAEAYILGDTAHFEHILFESSVGNAATLQLRGEGTLDLQSMEVAARFRPRSGLAIIRDIIGGIGDILYEIELVGPMREPRARIVPLP